MPSIEPLALLAIAVIVLQLVLIAASFRRPQRDRWPEERQPERPRRRRLFRLPRRRPGGQRLGVTRRPYGRVVRVVTLTFLATALAVVSVTQQWPRTSNLIYLLLGGAILFTLFTLDLLPGRSARARLLLQSLGGIVLVTALVALTGAYSSPFVYGYHLIVVGAGVALGARAALVLAALASLAFLLHPAVDPVALGVRPSQATGAAVALVALWLLAYLASAAGGRRGREVEARPAVLDQLTGLYDRTQSRRLLEQEIQRASRSGRPFSLLMLDVDDLRLVNELFGRDYGDRVIRAVADVVRVGVRLIDTVGRHGDDAFVVLLPETGRDGALVLADKLRRGVAEISWRTEGRPVRVSASLAVVTYPDDGTTADQLLMSADAAVAEAKRVGKNRIVSYAPAEASSAEPAAGAAPAPAAALPGRPGGASVGGASGPSGIPQPAGNGEEARPRPVFRPPEQEVGRAAGRRRRVEPGPEPAPATSDTERAEPPSRPATSGPGADEAEPRALAAPGLVVQPPTAPRSIPGGEPRPRPAVARRFQVIHHDEDDAVDRTMRHLLSSGADDQDQPH